MDILKRHIWIFVVFLGFACASDSAESLQTNTEKGQSKHETEIKHRYFVGASLGYGMSLITSSGVIPFTDSGNGLNYGFYIGQETRMPESDFSARYYTSLDYISVNYPGKLNIDTFKIGFNFDVLYSIKHYLDIFGGLGVGFNFFGGNFIDELYDSYISPKIGDINLWANLGIRKLFANRHSLEFFTRVAILPSTIYDTTVTNIYTGATGRFELKDRTHTINIRYIFLF